MFSKKTWINNGEQREVIAQIARGVDLGTVDGPEGIEAFVEECIADLENPDEEAVERLRAALLVRWDRWAWNELHEMEKRGTWDDVTGAWTLEVAPGVVIRHDGRFWATVGREEDESPTELAHWRWAASVAASGRA